MNNSGRTLHIFKSVFVLQTVLTCEVKIPCCFGFVLKHVTVFSKCLGLSALVDKLTLSSPVPNPIVKAPRGPPHQAEDSSFPDTTTKTGMKPLPMPPPLELPQVCGEGQSFSRGLSMSVIAGLQASNKSDQALTQFILIGEKKQWNNCTYKNNRTPYSSK